MIVGSPVEKTLLYDLAVESKISFQPKSTQEITDEGA